MNQNNQDFNAQFVPFGIAEQLKNLGFRGKCLYYRITPSKMDLWLKDEGISEQDYNEFDGQVSMPTFGQAFAFFREKFGLMAYPLPYSGGSYYIALFSKGENGFGNYEDFEIADKDVFDYREAENACLDKLIELAKETKNA